MVGPVRSSVKRFVSSPDVDGLLEGVGDRSVRSALVSTLVVLGMLLAGVQATAAPAAADSGTFEIVEISSNGESGVRNVAPGQTLNVTVEYDFNEAESKYLIQIEDEDIGGVIELSDDVLAETNVADSSGTVTLTVNHSELKQAQQSLEGKIELQANEADMAYEEDTSQYEIGFTDANVYVKGAPAEVSTGESATVTVFGWTDSDDTTWKLTENDLASGTTIDSGDVASDSTYFETTVTFTPDEYTGNIGDPPAEVSATLTASGATSSESKIDVVDDGSDGGTTGPQTNDVYETNDGFDGASTVFTGTYGDLAVVGGESDYYSISLGADERLNATATVADTNGTVSLVVYDSDERFRNGSYYTTDAATATTTPESAGTYYVEVYGTGTSGANYSLSLSTETVTESNDAYEDNDDFDTASSLSTGTYDDLAVVDGESDYYGVSLEDGETLNATATFDDSAADLSLVVYDPEEGYIDGSYSFTDDESATVTARENGTHYVRVYGYSGTANYSLALSTPTTGTSDDTYEDNDGIDTASGLSTGTYDDLAVVDGDDDYYGITLDGDEQLNATALFDDSAGDLSVAVYGPDGDYIDGSYSLTDDETAVVTADDAGTYHVKVSGYSGTTANYSLNLSTRTLTESNDAYEPNDGFDDAESVFEGTYADLRVADGESDYYSMYLDANETLTATATFDDAQGDLNLVVYGPDESWRSGSYSLTDDESVTVDAESAGTHYIEVYGYAGTSNNYSLDLSTTVENNDIWENDDSFESATSVIEGLGYDAMIVDGESDYYKVDVQQGQWLNATVEFDDSQGNIDVEVYDPEEGYLDGSYSFTDDETVSVSADQTGTYYVRVEGASPNVSNNYTMEARTRNVTKTDDAYEDNDRFDTATSLSTGTYDALRILDGEEDYYAVDLDEGEQLTATAEYTDSTTGTIQVEIYDGDENWVNGSSYNDGETTLTANAESAGTYYIEVATLGDTAGNYSLDLSTTQSTDDNDIWEPNDGFDNATYPVTGSPYDAKIATGDVDYYQVDLNADQRLNATVEFDDSQGNIDAEIYGPDERWQNGSYSLTDDETVTATADSAGAYYVLVYAAFADTSNDYTIEVTTENTTESNDAFEDNDGFDSAARLTTGTYSGLDIVDGESDYYSVSLSKGETLNATADFSNADGSFSVVIYDSSEFWENGTYYRTDDATATTTADSAGTYYVEVYGLAGDSADYTLDLSTENATETNDAFEDNDGFDSAARLTTGTYSGLDIVDGEDDYYSVSLEDGETLNATAEFSNVEGDLTIAAYDSDQVWQTGDYFNTERGSVELTADGAGTYYVRVYGYSGESGDYSLTLSTEDSSDTGNDAYEDNDGFDSASSLTTGTYENLKVVDGESDYYSVSLSKDETLNATATFDDTEGNLNVDVYGPDEYWDGGSYSLTDDETATVTADQSGTYYVEVYGAYSDTTANYTLDLSTEAATETNDAYEPNDGFDSAASLSTGTYSDLRVTDGEDDYYSVYLEDGETLNATAEFSNVEGDLTIAAYDSDQVWQTGDYFNTERGSVELTADGAGTYYVRVYGYSGESGDYSLSLSTTTTDSGLQSDAYEDNDGFDTASSLSTGTYEGLTVTEGESDFYSVSVSKGETLNATAEFSNVGGDGLTVSVYNASEFWQNASYFQTDETTVTTTADESGTYYVEVSGFSGDSGEYTLTLSTSGSDSTTSATLLDTGFEDDSVGELPSEWTVNGNSDQAVVDSTAASGDRSLELSGSAGGCWEAISNRNLDLPDSGTVTISLSIRPTSDGEAGCHGDRNGRITLGTSDDSWSAGSDHALMSFSTDGSIGGDGVSLGNYTVGEWTSVNITYEMTGEETTITYTVDGQQRGQVTVDEKSYEDDLSYLQLSSGDFTVYYDDITVTSG